MKRSLQLLFLLVLAQAAIAQEDFYNDYIITISGTMAPFNDPNGGCGSGFYFNAIFEDGTQAGFVPFTSVGGPGTHQVSGRLVFSSNNKVKSLSVWARNENRHTSGCKGSTFAGVLPFTPTYPCQDQDYLFHSGGAAYDFYVTVKISPLTKNDFNLTTSVDLRNNANQEFANDPIVTEGYDVTVSPHKGGFKYLLTTHFDDGSSEATFSEGFGYFDYFEGNETISRQRSVFYSGIRKPVTVTLTAEGTVDFFGPGFNDRRTVIASKKSVATHNLTIPDLPIPGTTAATFALYPYANASRVAFTGKTFNFPIKYGPDAANILPYDTANRVIILGPAGNPPSFYHWVYSSDGMTWTDLPEKFQGKQRLSISGYDLQGEAFMNYHNTNVFFKLVIDCNGGESDVLTLSRRISAPNIVAVTPLPDRCFDVQRDGAFKITFNRPLLVHSNGSRETLNILVRDLSNANPPDQILEVSLDENHSLTWPRRLQSDREYEISLIDTYLGAFVYSDNKTNHYDTVALVRPQPVASIIVAEAVHCYNGGDGKINITAAGGAGNYSLQYVKPGGETLQLSLGSETTAAIDFVRQGNYTVQLRDGNGCSDQAGIKSITINQPLSALQIGYSEKTDPLAYGYTDGFIETIVVGGTPYADKRYSTEWYDPATLLASTLYNNAVLSEGYQANINGLGDGSYVLKAYDSQYALAHPDHRAGCYVESEVFRLIQPPALTITISEHHYVSCYGSTDGALTASAQGGLVIAGASPYRYQWLMVENGTPRTIGQTTDMATQLKAGVYIIKVTDQNNIEKLSDPFTLRQPDLLQAQVATSPVSCFGGSDGVAEAAVLGGTAPYTYEWDEGSTTSTANALPQGTYFVLATDARGCSASASGKVSSPQPVASALTSEAVHCYDGGDGKINIMAQGGVGNYTYEYVKPGTTQAISASMGSGTTAVIDFLRQGLHTILLRDGNGCQDQDGIKSITVNQPAPLYIGRAATTPPRAFGYTDGAIETTVLGGTPYADKHYTIEWYDPVNLLPASLQNNAVLANAYQANINGIGDGSYILKVYDSQYAAAHPDHRAGCTVQSDVLQLIQPPPLLVTIQQDHKVSCYGYDDGELTAIAQGGIKIPGDVHYQYEWLIVDNGTPRPIGKNDSTANRLKAGIYQVRITDRNDIEKISDPIALHQPTNPISSTVTSEAVHCYNGGDGRINIVARGGVGNYNLEYAMPGSTHTTRVAMSADNTAVIDLLRHGTYTVYVHDSDNCNDTDGIKSITVSQPSAPLRIAHSQAKDPLAYGYTDGLIQTIVKDGTPYADKHYTIEWYNPVNLLPASLQNNAALADGYQADIRGLGDGSYILKVYDSQYPLAHPDHRAGCYAESQRLQLIQPPPLLVTVHERHYVTCNGFNDGVLSARARGGIKITGALPYRYQWLVVENGASRPINQSDSIATRLKSGVYSIKITDKNGIEKISDPFALVQPEALKATMATTPVSCNSGEDGTAEARVLGGTSPYTYAWSDASTGPKVNHLIEGSYFVWVKDNRGCTTSASGKVTSPFTLTVDSLVRNPQCFGYSNGAIDINVKQGSAPYRYEWSTGAVTEDIDGLAEGNYRVLITDGNNCRSYRVYNVKNPEPVQIDLGGERYLCNDQQYQADASWKDPNTSYLWTGPAGFTAATARVTLTQAGAYHVHLTDSHGCNGEDALTIKRLGIDIASEFIVSTQAFAETEVTLLNVSTPQPDSVQWSANDAEGINFTSKQERKATVVFSEEGAYTLYLKAYRQGCEAVFSKTITVLGKSFDDSPPEEPPFIEAFTISPIPTRGSFTVTITLREVSSIRMRLISVVNNVVVSDRTEQGSSEYTLPYTMNLAAGIYLLLLESPNGNNVAKVIVQ